MKHAFNTRNLTNQLPPWLSRERIRQQYRETEETQVQSLDQGDPLEGELWQPTPVFLPEKSHEEEPGELPSRGLQKSWTWLSTRTHTQITKHLILA